MFSYETPLTRLVPGDIFSARCSGGQSLICIVLEVTPDVIRARTLTHQLHFAFDRRTGSADWTDKIRPPEPTRCQIDSIEPLPIEIHNVLLGLDRKMRLTLNEERGKLNPAERAALRFVGDYYPRHPIDAAGTRGPETAEPK